MNISNKEKLFYGLILSILIYIWYNGNISINYLFPFLLFCIFFYYRETNKEESFEENTNKIKDLIDELYDERYKYLETEEIVLFIETLKPIRQFNIPQFNEFLSYLNIYFKERSMSKLLKAIHIFESLYFALTVEMTDYYSDRIIALKTLMLKYLKVDDMKRIEMQEYLPYDYIQDNFK